MPHAPSSALNARHQVVRRLMRERSLDAIVVTSLPNILYLTNFGGSTAIVLLTLDRLLFLTDFRYVTTIGDMRGTPYECPGLELVTIDGSYEAKVVELVSSIPGMPGMPATRVGFEAAHLSVARHAWMQGRVAEAASAPELVPTETLVETARLTKDSYEIAALREGARRLSRVARELVAEIRAGRTELEISFAIDTRMRDAGFEKPAFDTIVAGGPNGALPHATPGERKLSEGDLVVLDFGGIYDSYCVDLTRTVSVGRASPRAREVYGAVLQAHDLAISRVKPQTSRFAIDAAARDSLAAAGMGEAFGHGTGHGLGIEIHEDPRIGRRRTGIDLRDEVVGAGMVFTIEPGAYFPGWGGVRIEDDVLVTETGVDVLTDAPTELLEL